MVTIQTVEGTEQNMCVSTMLMSTPGHPWACPRAAALTVPEAVPRAGAQGGLPV